MTKPEVDYLREFFAALDPKQPLDPGDKRRVPIYQRLGPDPIDELRASIEWAPIQSTHLFSGFRGTGKTTELRRLAEDLRSSGALVVYSDMREYLNFEDVVDVSHFLLSLAGAFSEALTERELLGKDVAHEGYWTRFRHFMTRTDISFPTLEASTAALGDAGIKASLRTDPSFRDQLRTYLGQGMSAFIKDVHDFMRESVALLRQVHGQDTRIVFILDSIEQISVKVSNHDDVSQSINRIFSTHANDLQFDDLHLVYTAPPWLKIANKGISALFHGTFTLPCVKVRNRDGSACEVGVQILLDVIERREPDWRRLFEDEAALRRLAFASGGYLRDLFQLVRRCLLHGRTGLPITNDVVALAEAEIANNYKPISHADARWLARVAASHKLPELTRHFDVHLVFCYVNGSEWYDVHPLLTDHIAALVERLA